MLAHYNLRLQRLSRLPLSPPSRSAPTTAKSMKNSRSRGGGQVIDLSSTNVKSITVLKPGATDSVTLERNTDSTLWFNIQNKQATTCSPWSTRPASLTRRR